MTAQLGRRRLVVNADDFGRNTSINEAVIRAHREGILTTASLMVNEPACDEAVILARQNPGLGVGLHLSLLCGTAGLDAARIPRLAREGRVLPKSPVAAGFRYFFVPGIRQELRAEIHEQFRRFRETGLELDHVNGHLHMHLHPAVLAILLRDARELGIKRMRLTADPLLQNLRLARGAFLYRVSHWIIFGALSARARPQFGRLGIRHTDRVFGLLQNARVDRAYVEGLLKTLPPGDSELYSHPCVKDFKEEFEALLGTDLRARVKARGIELLRYQDL
jgi:hopanoid biosynthesis associated protein HpnK